MANTRGEVPETAEQVRAYEVWRDQGERRSNSRVAKIAGVTHVTISHWAKKFHWKDRLRMDQAVPDKAIGTALTTTTIDSDLDKIISSGMYLLEQSVGYDPVTGEFNPQFAVENVKEFVLLTKAMKDFIALRHDMDSRQSTKSPISSVRKLADSINIITGSMSGEDQIKFLKGAGIPGVEVSEADPGRNVHTSGGISPGDYDDIPGKETPKN